MTSRPRRISVPAEMIPTIRILVLLTALGGGFACQTPDQGPKQHFPPDLDLPFSRAVKSGRTLYVAGHLGLVPNTRKPPDDPAEEARLMLDAFEATMKRAGYTMDDLVSVEVFCSDLTLFDTFNQVYKTRFNGAFPARAFIGSGPLLFSARFEMKGVAVKD